MLEITVGGQPFSITLPSGLKAGDDFSFTVKIDETKDVYASTLHCIPGMDIIHSKEIVYGSVSVYSDSMGRHIHELGHLIQKATDAARREAILKGCNAVLGMTYNVANDSSGQYGENKTVIVTAVGTPCVVVKSQAVAQPTVAASAPPLVTAQVYVPPA